MATPLHMLSLLLALGLALPVPAHGRAFDDAPRVEGPVHRATLGGTAFHQSAQVGAASALGAGLCTVAYDGSVILWGEDGEVLARTALPPGRYLAAAGLESIDRSGTPEAALLVGVDGEGLVAVGLASGPLALEDLGLADRAAAGAGVACAPGGERFAQWQVEGTLIEHPLTIVSLEGDARLELATDGFRVDDVAWSPAGDLLTVLVTNGPKVLRRAGTDEQDSSRVLVFDAGTGEEVARATFLDEFCTALDFGPLEGRAADGHARGLVVVGGPSGARVVDLSSGDVLARFAEELGGVQSLSATPGGEVLLAGAGLGLELHRVHLDREPELLGRLDDPAHYYGLVTLGSGERIAGRRGRGIAQWEVPSLERRPPSARHTARIAAIAAGVGGRVLTASYDGTARLWSVETGAPGPLLAGHVGLLYGADFAPDGRPVTGGQDGTLRFWDPETGEEVQRNLVGSLAVTDLAFAPDGSALAVADAEGRLSVRDPATGEAQQAFEGLGGLILRVAWSGDARFLACGANGVRIWRAGSWHPDLVLEDLGSPVTALALSDDGRWLAVGTAQRHVLVYDRGTGDLLRAWTGFAGRPSDLAFAPGSTLEHAVLAAVGPGEGGVRRMEVVSGEELARVPTPGGADLASVGFAGPERLLAGGEDGFGHIWDL